MTPGTTPTNTFTLPITPPSGTKFRVVYAQGEDHNEVFLFDKTTEDCTIEGNKLTVRLEAHETMKIDTTPKWHNGKFELLPVKMQVGMETPAGDIFWSNIIEESPDRLLKKDGVV